LTIGNWFGRDRFVRIHNGSVCCWPAVNVVTITSSNDSANASSAPATIADRSAGNVTSRNVVQVLAPRSADASFERARGAPQPRDHVVVDHDDAERGVTDDHREQAKARCRAA
jgi:hypothetical protein